MGSLSPIPFCRRAVLGYVRVYPLSGTFLGSSVTCECPVWSRFGTLPDPFWVTCLFGVPVLHLLRNLFPKLQQTHVVVWGGGVFRLMVLGKPLCHAQPSCWWTVLGNLSAYDCILGGKGFRVEVTVMRMRWVGLTNCYERVLLRVQCVLCAKHSPANG